MKLDDADLEQSYFQTIGKGVDKSVGYVLVGLFVVLFFTLLLSGIQRVQSVSSNVVTELPQVSNQPNPEISDLVGSEKN